MVRIVVTALVIIFMSLFVARADAQQKPSISDHEKHTIFTSLNTATIFAVGQYTDLEGVARNVWTPNAKLYFIHPAKRAWIGGVSIGLATNGIGPYFAITPIYLGGLSLSVTP